MNLESIHQMFKTDFINQWRSKVSPDELEVALKAFEPSDQSYPASGLVKSVGVVAWFTLDVPPFVGEFKGWATPFVIAEGPLSGYISSPDFSRLTNTCHAFYFWLAAAYIHISFYDVPGNNLGTFYGSSVGAVAVGGGPGSWNQN